MPDTFRDNERRDSLAADAASARAAWDRLADFARWTVLEGSVNPPAPVPAPVRSTFRRRFGRSGR